MAKDFRVYKFLRKDGSYEYRGVGTLPRKTNGFKEVYLVDHSCLRGIENVYKTDYILDFYDNECYEVTDFEDSHRVLRLYIETLEEAIKCLETYGFNIRFMD